MSWILVLYICEEKGQSAREQAEESWDLVSAALERYTLVAGIGG